MGHFDFGEGGIDLWVPFIIDYRDNRQRPEEVQLSCHIRRVRTVDQMARANETDTTLFRWRKEKLGKWLKNPAYAEHIQQMGPDILRGFKQFVEHTRHFRNFRFDGVEVTDPYEIFLRLPLPPQAVATDRDRVDIEELLRLIVDGAVEDVMDLQAVGSVGLAQLNEQVQLLEQLDGVEGGDDGAFEQLQTTAQVILKEYPQPELGIVPSIQQAIRASAGLTGEELKNFVWECAGKSAATTPVPMESPTASDALADETPADSVAM